MKSICWSKCGVYQHHFSVERDVFHSAAAVLERDKKKKKNRFLY